MYNDPSAKDLLAQYPRRLAEGGDVTEKPKQSWQAPVVVQKKPTLTPIYAPGEVPAGYTGKYIDPTVLSASQQSARERAAQDAMLARALQSTGTSKLGGLDYRQLQQGVRSGDISETNLQEKVVNPIYEQRVKNAYAAIGRTGAVLPELVMPTTGKPSAANYQNVTQAEYDNWLNQLKSGTLSGADFQNKFLTANATTIPTTNLEAQMTYINRSRAALGMPPIDKTGKVLATTPATTTTPNAVLFNQGGAVEKKSGESETTSDEPRAMNLEQWLLNQSQAQVGPVNMQEVRSNRGPGKYDTRISRDEDGFQAFADVDVGGKKLSQVGARLMGQGRIGNYEVQYVYDPETKQPVITGAIRKELSPTSDVSAEGVYVPQKDGKDYYNAGIRYTKRFEDGGEVTADDIERVNKESYFSPNGVAPEMGEVKPKYPALNAWSKGLELAAAPFDKYALDKRIPLVGGMTAADLTGMNDVASLAKDVSYGDPVVRGKSLQTSKIDPRLLAVADIVPVAGAAAKGATTLAKAGAKEVARQVETGTGVIGRNTMDPRMYIDAYHGSPKDFDKFDINAPKNTSGGLNKHGIFLSPEKEVGKRYAEDFGKEGVLYKVDADVKKPLNLTATQYEKLQSIVGKLDENKKLNEFEQISLENLLGPIGWDMNQHPIEAIKKAGYDSITKSKGKFGVAESELMVFDPNRLQILEKTPVGTKSEFKMTDLPAGDRPREVYKIPSGTLLYHGAHGDSAKKIVESGSQLKSNLPYRSSGGTTDEGGLIWLGDKETASYFAESRADPMAVSAEQQRTGQKRKPGQVFAMTTDKPLKLVSRNYVMTQKEADALNEALGLPEYKHLQKGYTLETATSRAHNYRASNIDRYKVEHVGEISSPWPVILRTLKADGFYDGSGIALSADALPVAPVKKKHGGEVTDFIKTKK